MGQPKYSLDKEDSIEWEGRTLYRIIAERYFRYIQKGSKGGYVEHEDNLSHEGDCWIYDSAKVFGNAWITDSAEIRGLAQVYDDAVVSGSAEVCGYAKVYGESSVKNNSVVDGSAQVRGSSAIAARAQVRGDSIVEGYSNVLGMAVIDGNAVVGSSDDYLLFKNDFSSGRFFTWTRSNDRWAVGCFRGTGKELLEKAFHDGPRTLAGYKYHVELVENLKKLKESSVLDIWNIELSIPKWWADILDRVLLPYSADMSLSVNTPFGSDYRNMEDFWESLHEELGYDIHSWCEENLSDGDFVKWENQWSETDLILAYLNPRTRRLLTIC